MSNQETKTEIKMYKSFKTADPQGNELELRVVRPSPNTLRRSNIHKSAVFSQLVTAKPPAILRQALVDVMRKQGLWDDDKQKEMESLEKTLEDGQYKLKAGGIKLKEAYKIAISMRKTRRKLMELRSVRNRMDEMTAEGQSDNEAFNFLVAECTLNDETGERYFPNYEYFIEHSNDQAAIEAATNLMGLLYGLDSNDYEAKLPENKFLKDFNFVNDKLRLVNKDGKLIDESGKLINEDGYLVNEAGELVDEDGKRITADGEYAVETKPFLDDEGNAI